jgi:hypothetical protein
MVNCSSLLLVSHPCLILWRIFGLRVSSILFCLEKLVGDKITGLTLGVMSEKSKYSNLVAVSKFLNLKCAILMDEECINGERDLSPLSIIQEEKKYIYK